MYGVIDNIIKDDMKKPNATTCCGREFDKPTYAEKKVYEINRYLLSVSCIPHCPVPSCSFLQ